MLVAAAVWHAMHSSFMPRWTRWEKGTAPHAAPDSKTAAASLDAINFKRLSLPL